MPENPYEEPHNPANKAKPKPRVPFAVRLVLYVAIIGLVIALMLPAVRTARPAAQRNTCLNNVKQIVLAMHKYEEVNGTFPPAYTVDDNGNRLHSWRTLLLPYLEEAALYETIDLSKPWDDPANAQARQTMPDIYQCPSARHEDFLTSYVAVVGPECALAGSQAKGFDDFSDGASKTIIVIEVPANLAVHWMSPDDVTIDEILAITEEAETNHPSVMIVGIGDGSSRAIGLGIDRSQLRAMLTASGGEEFPTED